LALLKNQRNGGNFLSGSCCDIGMAKMRFIVFGFLIFALMGCEADMLKSEFNPTLKRGSYMPSTGLPDPLSVIQKELDSPYQTVQDNQGDVRNVQDLSDENDFEAVSSRQTIESDAQRLEQNRSTYRVIEPTDLPIRSETGQPNIVEYALRTTNALRASLYKRGPFASERLTLVNCNQFESASKAQEAFLSKGGPKWDRLGLDPDGDGFACTWDPTPFRLARSG
jgi:hypothetical protein